MSSWLSALLNVAAAIAQVILSLSPTPDIYKVYRRKHIGEMVALPLVAMAVNNHLCLTISPDRMLYGYLTDNVFPLLVTQAFSQLAAIVYNAIYFRWSSEHKRIELLKLYTRAFVLHCAVSTYFALGLAGITGQTKADVGTWLGYAGVVVNVWMYASPLATLKHVVETKNSDSIPINLSAMILVSTLLWLGTGIIDSDFFITGINAVDAEPFKAAETTMSIWVAILNVATAIAQVILSLSLTPDIYNVHRRKGTGEMAALPLVAMAVNNHAWMLYGYLADNMFPIFATQAFSQLAALSYNIVYFRWSVPEKRTDLLKLYTQAFVVHCAFSIYTVLGVSGVTNQTKASVGDWVGYAAIVINIWMYASPLATLKHVIETKSSASIPINLSAMIFVSASLWLASGIVDDDFFVWGINAIGTVLSFIQIVVYYIYRSSEVKAQSNIEDGDLTVVIDNATTAALGESPAYKPLPSPRIPVKK
uniref:Sugar transporter SWEET1 n=1 Tax=Phytophthora ramorum TaxID=164328 RepID=H3H2S5_PHYRM